MVRDLGKTIIHPLCVKKWSPLTIYTNSWVDNGLPGQSLEGEILEDRDKKVLV